MINLRFQRGSAFIQVRIENRTIEFITPMLNMQPIKIDLDKLDEYKERIEKMNIDNEFIEELSKLETEQQMADDLVKDLQKNGWEVVENGYR